MVQTTQKSDPAVRIFLFFYPTMIKELTVVHSAWSAAYPASTPDPEQMPQAWKDALSAAVAAGKIPDIPPSQPDADGFPTYPDGFDPNGPVVCSATYKCRNPADIWDAPDGSIGVGFDDGPEAVCSTLFPP